MKKHLKMSAKSKCLDKCKPPDCKPSAELKQECILNGPTWADDPEMILMCMCGDLEEDEVQFTTTSVTKKGKERKKSSTSGAPEAFPKKGRANETKVKTGVDTLSAMRAGRAGHCAAPVDSRLGVMIIGGLSLTQEMAQYDGDTVYHDDVFWMSTEWDQNKRRIKASRMQWWGPLKFPGPKLSARAHLSCDKVSLGRGAASVGAILTFGGYNGQGRCCGYFNDLHALINVERKRADINRIMEWMRKLQLDDLTFMTRARQNHTGPAESPYMDYDVNKKKIDLLDKKEVKRLFDQCKNKGQRTCKMMFNKDLPPPWSDHKQWQEFADKRGDALLEVEEPAAGQTKESRMMGMANPWPWDGWEEQPLWYPVSAKGRPPSPRAKHSTATIGSLFFVFGGFGPEGFLDDLHILNVETIRWLRTGRLIKVDDRGNPDDGSPTWLASKVKFLNDPKVVLGHPPSARAGHAATAMMGRMYVYGGYSSEAGLYGDVHVLDTWPVCRRGSPGSKSDYQKYSCAGQEGPFSWLKMKAVGVYPTPRFGHSMVTFGTRRSPFAFVLGGYEGGGEHGNWRKRTSLQGYHIEASVLDPMIPNATEVITPFYGRPPLPPVPRSPHLPKSFKFLSHMPSMIPKWPPKPRTLPPRGHGPTHARSWVSKAMAVPIRYTILGHNFGYSAEDKVVGVQLGNKDYGPFPCMPLVVVSPGELECDLWEGAGKELDVLAHGNLQVTIAGNKLFSYNPPEIVAVVPPFLIDFCWGDGNMACLPRGPFLIYGDNFGPDPKYVTELVFGGARCLKWKYVSHQLLICLCVGETKKDSAGQPLQGGVTVKVAGQYSNEAAFLFIPPPLMLRDTTPSVWYPVMCPGEPLLKDAGIIVSDNENLAQVIRTEEKELLRAEMNQAIEDQDREKVEEALKKRRVLILREQQVIDDVKSIVDTVWSWS